MSYILMYAGLGVVSLIVMYIAYRIGKKVESKVTDEIKTELYAYKEKVIIEAEAKKKQNKIAKELPTIRANVAKRVREAINTPKPKSKPTSKSMSKLPRPW